MSRRERDTRVRLERMSEEQIGTVRDMIHSALIGQASDLRFLNAAPDPRRAVREVAALGRLAFWLHHGEVLVPDRTARDLVARMVAADGEADRRLLESYEAAVLEHEAMRSFLAHLDAGRGDRR
ncbi:MAG: hypothetical protein QM729_21165 [Solirubrobacterales bacterium]